MSAGNIIYVPKENIQMNFGDGTMELVITVVNDDPVSDYAIQVPWSISAGSSTVGGDTEKARIGPDGTRTLRINMNHNLNPGTELYVCARADIDADNVTGL